jgi:hypothetical protein
MAQDRFKEVPPGARLVAAPQALTYLHVDRFVLPERVGAAEAFRIFTRHPPVWLRAAFKVRDALSRPFGVAPIMGFKDDARSEPRVGEKMDFFLVEAASPDQLVLTARDVHLDVMICVDVAPSGQGCDVAITASVVTHNAFGRVYMWVVGPAHRVITASMGRQARCRLAG